MFNATLVVMAAGMGSRFGGLKQLEPIGPNGETLLDFSVYDAKAAGFNKVVFIIKHEIEDDFKKMVGSRIEKMIDVEYAFQQTDALPDGYVCPPDRAKPWGTGHAIWCCRNIVHEPFAVINADDYYGKSAFVKIYDFLAKQTGDYCMVGFRLCNTLTENGSVSRGVCTVKDDRLVNIIERTSIIDCKYTENGESVTLPADTVVSMNMWGFTPDIFSNIEKGLLAFLDASINTPKAEYYLPGVVADIIAKNERDVRVLVAEDKWYGVTYKEDKANVVAALGKKIAAGEYK